MHVFQIMHLTKIYVMNTDGLTFFIISLYYPREIMETYLFLI